MSINSFSGYGHTPTTGTNRRTTNSETAQLSISNSVPPGAVAVGLVVKPNAARILVGNDVMVPIRKARVLFRWMVVK